MRRLTILALFLALSTGLFSLDYIRPYKKGNKIIFSFTDPQKKVQRAYLLGSMNNWNFRTLPLQKSMIGDRFFIALELEPGRYEYKYMVNSFLFQDMSNPLSDDDNNGKANSVLYVGSNGQLEWEHDDQAFVLEDGTWQLMETYAVDLEGYYTLTNLHIELTNMEIGLDQGWVRLARTEKGITGMVFWGNATLEIPGKDPLEGSGLFLRFHPNFFEENIKQYLLITNQQKEHMYCNNLFYLKNWRFYNMGDEFMIPPEGFVGVSLNNAHYQDEKLVTAFQYTYYDPQKKYTGNGARYTEKDITTAAISEMMPLYEKWMNAVSKQDIEQVKDIIYEPIFKGVAQIAMKMPVLAESTFEKSSVRVVELQAGPGMNTLDSPRLVVGTIKTAGGKTGQSSILVARFHDEWKIVNYTLSF